MHLHVVIPWSPKPVITAIVSKGLQRIRVDGAAGVCARQLTQRLIRRPGVTVTSGSAAFRTAQLSLPAYNARFVLAAFGLAIVTGPANIKPVQCFDRLFLSMVAAPTLKSWAKSRIYIFTKT
jgi:hypothetical protein